MRSQLYVCLLLCLSTGEALTLSMRSPRLFSTAAGTPRCWPVAAAKKGGKKKAKKSPPASGGGFGSTAKAAAPTPAERLKKSMELYEQLLKGPLDRLVVSGVASSRSVRFIYLRAVAARSQQPARRTCRGGGIPRIDFM